MSDKSTDKKTSSDTWQTRHSLIERVRNPEDNESWTEFRQHYYYYIFYTLQQVGLSDFDAKVVSQDVMVKLWKELPKFVYNKDRGKFRNWLTTVVRNEAISYFRKNNRHQNFINDQDKEDMAKIENNLQDNTLNKIIIDEWDIYISNLAWKSIEQRFEKPVQDVFLLHMDGLSSKEIAEKCGIKESSVYVYIHRIKNHLKDEIDRFNQELL